VQQQGRWQQAAAMVYYHFIHAQQQLIALTAWPWWALCTVEILVCLNAFVAAVDLYTTTHGSSRDNIDCNIIRKGESSASSSDSDSVVADHHKLQSRNFRIFQFKYLSVYFIIMLADWLQGTNMYTLYTSYGVNVGTLFLTGTPTKL
jgi:hypothetical protein